MLLCWSATTATSISALQMYGLFRSHGVQATALTLQFKTTSRRMKICSRRFRGSLQNSSMVYPLWSCARTSHKQRLMEIEHAGVPRLRRSNAKSNFASLLPSLMTLMYIIWLWYHVTTSTLTICVPSWLICTSSQRFRRRRSSLCSRRVIYRTRLLQSFRCCTIVSFRSTA